MPTIDYKNAKGERLSGVTTIINSNLGWSKGALMYWAWNEGREGRDFRKTRDIAADAGTIAHYLIECEIKLIEPDTSKFAQELLDKAETSFINYLEWKALVNFEPINGGAEVHLVSEKYQYGATPDCPAKIRGKTSLLDWKTGSGVYPDMLVQLEAYRHAWDENHPDNPITGGLHLLRIDREMASFHYHHWDALPQAWAVFLNLLEIHKMQKVLKKAT